MAAPRPPLRTARSAKVLSMFNKTAPITSPTYPSAIPLSALSRSQPPAPARPDLPSVYVIPPPEDCSSVTCAFDSTQPPSPHTPDLALLEETLAGLAPQTTDAPVFRRPSMRDMENGGVVLPRRRGTEPIPESGSGRSMPMRLERSSTEPLAPVGLGLRMPAPSPPPSIPLPPLPPVPTQSERPKVLPKRSSLFFGTRSKPFSDLDSVDSARPASPPPLQHPRPKPVGLPSPLVSEARIGSPPPSSLPLRTRPVSDGLNLGLPPPVVDPRSPPLPSPASPPHSSSPVLQPQSTSPGPVAAPSRVARPPLVRHTATAPPPSADHVTPSLTCDSPPMRKRVESTPSLGRRRRSIVFRTDGVLGEVKDNAPIRKRPISPPMRVTPRRSHSQAAEGVGSTEEGWSAPVDVDTRRSANGHKRDIRRPKSFYGNFAGARSTNASEIPTTIAAADVAGPSGEGGDAKPEKKLKRPRSLYGLPSIPGLSKYFSDSTVTTAVPPLPSPILSSIVDMPLPASLPSSPALEGKRSPKLRRPKSLYGLPVKSRQSVVALLPERDLPEVPEVPELPGSPPSMKTAKYTIPREEVHHEERKKVRRPKSLYALTAGVVSTVKLKGGEDEETPADVALAADGGRKKELRRPKSLVGLPSLGASTQPFPVQGNFSTDDVRSPSKEKEKARENRSSVRSRIRSLSMGFNRRSMHVSSTPPPPVPPLPLSLSNSTIRSSVPASAPPTPVTPLHPGTPITPATPVSPQPAEPSSPAEDSASSPSPSLTTDDSDSPVGSFESQRSPLSSPKLGISFGRKKRLPSPSRALPPAPHPGPPTILPQSPMKLDSMRFSRLGFDVTSFELSS